jgi:hypothetical protein
VLVLINSGQIGFNLVLIILGTPTSIDNASVIFGLDNGPSEIVSFGEIFSNGMTEN